MSLFGLVRRIFAHSQNKRLLRRMMLERDKYADIRLSGAVVAERGSPISSSRPNISSDSRAAVTPAGATRLLSPDDEADDSREPTTNVATTSSSSSSSSAESRLSQACLSVSACMVVSSQTSTEALWIDKLRAQEEAYKQQSLGNSLSSASSSDSARRRCESEDDAFDMWDYMCPQLLRPRLANEWI